MSKTVKDYTSIFPHTIGHDQSLAKAEEMMREHNVRHLPVLEGGQLVGLISERDLRFVESFKDIDRNKATVDESMIDEPYKVEANSSLKTVVEEMVENKYGSAIVTSDGKLLGIFTYIDAMRALRDLL